MKEHSVAVIDSVSEIEESDPPSREILAWAEHGASFLRTRYLARFPCPSAIG